MQSYANLYKQASRLNRLAAVCKVNPRPPRHDEQVADLELGAYARPTAQVGLPLLATLCHTITQSVAHEVQLLARVFTALW